jgi:hypothetical protein
MGPVTLAAGTPSAFAAPTATEVSSDAAASLIVHEFKALCIESPLRAQAHDEQARKLADLMRAIKPQENDARGAGRRGP